MENIKTILCPIDFSDRSMEAMRLALPLAASYNAEIYLIHILPKINFYDWNLTGMYAILSQESMEEEKKECTKKMETSVAEIKANYPTVSVSYEILDPSDMYQNLAGDIIHAIDKKKVDLVVMGSHGRRGLSRLLLGSVAESILRQAPCRVIIYKNNLLSNEDL